MHPAGDVQTTLSKPTCLTRSLLLLANVNSDGIHVSVWDLTMRMQGRHRSLHV